MMIRIKILIIGMFLILKVAKSQNPPDSSRHFWLNVHLTKKDTGRLILMYPSIESGFTRDTLIFSDGKALYKGSANEPVLSHLIDPDKGDNRISFFIEPGELKIYGSEDSLQSLTMIGSSSQDEWIRYLKSNADLRTEAERLSLNLRKIKDSAKTQMDSVLLLKFKEQIALVSNRIDSINLAFARRSIFYVQEHTNSYISSTLLYGLLVNKQIETKTARNYFEKFANNVRGSKTGKLISKEFE
ncbi:MAG: DUF4369 domain-containing protein, partial [Flavobacterium sp.]|nr:DUF4369 domain-containing protein [Pedobacter sp.]